MELKDITKITGIITQGAKTLSSEMFVRIYTLEYSEDGKRWTKYTDDEDYEQKVSNLRFWDYICGKNNSVLCLQNDRVTSFISRHFKATQITMAK